MFQSNIRFLEFQSKILNGYPLSSLVNRLLSVLLPSDYDSNKAYPCIWFLGGFGSNGRDFLNDQGPFKISFPEIILRNQMEKIIPPFISIFPDCTTDLGGSQYINSDVNGPYMDHLCDELVPFIQKHFKTIESPEGRIIAGHSSGGYGALMTTLLKPKIFGSAIVSAADSTFECTFLPMWLEAAINIQKFEGVDGFLNHFKSMKEKGKVSSTLFHTHMMIAMASCFSPKLNNNNAHCELPIDLNTLELNKQVWNRWMNWDPCVAIEKYHKNLTSLSYLHLDCGVADEYGAQFGHRRIRNLLDKYNISHLYTEFDGTHRSTSFRYDLRFQRFAEFVNNKKLFS